MTTQNPNLAALSAAGVSVWLDDLSRERLQSGNLQELIDTKSVVGVTTNPSIFQKAFAEGDAYDDQIAELAERGADVDATIRTVTTDDVRNACDVLAPCMGGLRRRRRPGVHRGRPAAGQRHRQDHRAGHRAVEDRRPAEPVHQDPGHQGRPAGHHRRSGGRDFGQRHADLLGRTAPRGDGRLPGRHGEGPRSRSRPVQDPFGGIVLRLPGGHRGGQAAGEDRLRRRRSRCAGRPVSPTPGWPTPPTRRSSTAATVTRRSRPTAPGCSGRCGRRPGVKNPDYSDTLYVTELVAPNTVNTMPEKTIDAVADHGVINGDTVTGTGCGRSGGVRQAVGGGNRPDRRVRRAGERGCGEVRRLLDRAARARRRSNWTPPPNDAGRAAADAAQWRNPLRDKRDKRLPRIAGPCAMVIFGVTGDLARKKVMPAVYDLANRGLLPPTFALVGFARRDWDHDRISPRWCTTPSRSTAARRSGRRSGSGWPRDSVSCQAAFDDDDAFGRLAETLEKLDAERGTGGNHAFYLAIPPKSFPGGVRAAAQVRVGPPARRPVEPGGHRETVRPRPGQRTRPQPRGQRASSPRSRSSASTTTWAKRRCRTSWRCASPTSCSTRSGTRTTSTTCRSRWPKTSAWAAAPATTTASARPATSSRTT